MKKIIIPIMLILTLSLAACGKKADTVTKVSQSPSGEAEVSSEPIDEATELPSASEEKTEDTGKEQTTADSGEYESMYLINGTSMEIYAIYISENVSGNVGENIIEGSPLANGEEIELPYINSGAGNLNIIIEDESGVRYSAPLNLQNGASIELRLNGGSLEAVVQ